MRKLNWLFVGLIVLLSNCSKDNLELTTDPNQDDTDLILKSGGDGKYDILGYGYDATGRVAHSSSSKFQVIDLAALKNALPNCINEDLSKHTYFSCGTYEDASDYLYKISGNAKIGINLELFSGELKSSFSYTRTALTKESYAEYNLLIKDKHLTINENTSVLSNYLTANFNNDLKTRTPQEIISKYGTHVLMDIEIGAKLHILYKATVENSSKKETVAAGLKSKILKIFNFDIGGDYDLTLTSNNKNETLFFETTGGENSKGLLGIVTAGQTPTGLSINNWQSSCGPNNYAFINSAPGTMIPIYELVNDPTKKQALKEAIEQYVKNSQLKKVLELYRYWNPKKYDHFYTTNWNELGIGKDNYYFDWIQGYVFPVNSTELKTVPLYRYWNVKIFDHYYTTDFSELGTGKDGYVFEWIECKVYKNANDNLEAVPLYRYWNAKLKDHWYTTDFNELGYGKEGWVYEKIACYIFK